jgi:cytidylate kinase
VHSYNGKSVKLEMTREDLEMRCRHLVEKCKAICEIVMQEAAMTWDQIDRILLTGGMTRMPSVREMVKGIGNRPVAAAVNAAKALDLAAIDEHRIRSSAVGLAASSVASISAVRTVLRLAQRSFAADPAGAVLDGRDIATVICPDADVKLFVTAALPVRTQRRLAELQKRGESIGFAALEAQIAERDRRDIERADSPLRQAADAHLLDTTDLSIEASVEAACQIIDAALSRPGT